MARPPGAVARCRTPVASCPAVAPRAIACRLSLPLITRGATANNHTKFHIHLAIIDFSGVLPSYCGPVLNRYTEPPSKHISKLCRRLVCSFAGSRAVSSNFRSVLDALGPRDSTHEKTAWRAHWYRGLFANAIRPRISKAVSSRASMACFLHHSRRGVCSGAVTLRLCP